MHSYFGEVALGEGNTQVKVVHSTVNTSAVARSLNLYRDKTPLVSLDRIYLILVLVHTRQQFKNSMPLYSALGSLFQKNRSDKSWIAGSTLGTKVLVQCIVMAEFQNGNM